VGCVEITDRHKKVIVLDYRMVVMLYLFLKQGVMPKKQSETSCKVSPYR